MKYFLVGYMACGKTRRGREMAQEMGLPFIDLDAYVVERRGQTIAEIFATEGESGFRRIESEYLKEVCELYENFVMSTGGGVPCFYGNMEYMNRQGHTIFLNTNVGTITERLIRGKHKRPLVAGLSDEEIRDFVIRHREERLPFYLMAKEVIEC